MRSILKFSGYLISILQVISLSSCEVREPNTESSKTVKPVCADICNAECAEWRTPEEDATCKSKKIELKVTKVNMAKYPYYEVMDWDGTQQWAKNIIDKFKDQNRIPAADVKSKILSYQPLISLNGGLINKQHQFKYVTRSGNIYSRFDYYTDIWAPAETRIKGVNLCGENSDVNTSSQLLRAWDNDKAMYVWTEDANWGDRNIANSKLVNDYEIAYSDGQKKPFNVIVVLEASRYEILKRGQGKTSCDREMPLYENSATQYETEISPDLQKKMIVRGAIASTTLDIHSAIIQVYLEPLINPTQDYCADYAARFQRVLAHEIGHYLISTNHVKSVTHLMNDQTDCRAQTVFPFADLDEFSISATSTGAARWVP